MSEPPVLWWTYLEVVLSDFLYVKLSVRVMFSKKKKSHSVNKNTKDDKV